MGLIGSVLLGIFSLFMVMFTASCIDSDEETSAGITLLSCVLALISGAGAVLAGRTYYPRTNYKEKKPNVFFAIVPVVCLLLTTAQVIFFSLKFDAGSVAIWGSIWFSLITVSVFFCWLFYRRLSLKGKRRFKMICALTVALCFAVIAGAMTIRTLTTVMIGDQHIKVSEESVSVYGDLLTNRDMERLTRLKNLKSLSINNCFLDNEDVQYISELTSLTSLNLSSNSDITDVSPLLSLKQLEKLCLNRTDITDISEFASLEQLEYLEISKTKVTDLSCLSSFPALKSLSVSAISTLDTSTLTVPETLMFLEAEGIGLTSLDFIVPSKDNLYILNVGANNITDLAPLEGFAELGKIDLQSNDVSDISPLSGISLESLDIEDNNVKDISVLMGMKNLRCVKAGFNKIEDISPLEGITALTQLQLNNNNISDISAIKDCFRISDLDLAYNQIADISALATVDNLKYIHLKHNRISDISPLAPLMEQIEKTGGLTDLSYNEISDISVLEGYTGTWLNLSHNKISDISAASSFTQIERLYLDSNEITDISPLDKCKTLKYVSLNFNRITEINSLFYLPQLGTVNAAGNDITNVSGLDTIVNSGVTKRYLGLTYREGIDLEMLAGCDLIHVTFYDMDERTKNKQPSYVFGYSTAENLKAEEELRIQGETKFKSYIDTADDDDTDEEEAAVSDAA